MMRARSLADVVAPHVARYRSEGGIGAVLARVVVATAVMAALFPLAAGAWTMLAGGR